MWSISDAHHQVQDGSCNLIVMNPPFVRPTNQTGKNTGNRIPPWAAFNATDTDQRKMSDLAAKKFAGTCAHGGAGIASNFIAVCHKKIHPHGTMALILPATVSAGSSWKAVRQLLEKNYDLTIVSIADYAITPRETSFSSDTGMAEIILVAKRRAKDATANRRNRFVSLRSRPSSLLEAILIGDAIRSAKKIDKLESLRGGTPLRLGNTLVGTMLDCPAANTWKFVNVVDPLVEQAAFTLQNDRIDDSSRPCRFDILKSVYGIGPISRDIIGTENGRIRGPFNKYPIQGNPRYTALWNNNKTLQTRMVVSPDVGLEPKSDASDEHVKKIWSTASRVHINISPRFTSNKLIAALTEKKIIGGTTWPSIKLPRTHEKAFVLWCNSTLGIICFWSHASKQQLGRGRSSPTAIEYLPIPMFHMIGDKKLNRLSKSFDNHSDHNLDIMKNLWRDPVRIAIDSDISDIICHKIDMDDLRLRFCLEPSISGGCPEKDLLDVAGMTLAPADRNPR